MFKSFCADSEWNEERSSNTVMESSSSPRDVSMYRHFGGVFSSCMADLRHTEKPPPVESGSESAITRQQIRGVKIETPKKKETTVYRLESMFLCIPCASS